MVTVGMTAWWGCVSWETDSEAGARIHELHWTVLLWSALPARKREESESERQKLAVVKSLWSRLVTVSVEAGQPWAVRELRLHA